MKKITMMMACLFIVCFAMTSYAQMQTDEAFELNVWVVEANQYPLVPVVGASVTLTDYYPPQTRYTDSIGRAVFSGDGFHGWCGTKRAVIQKNGFTTQTRYIYDHTCPECYGNDPDDVCAPYMHVEVILEPGGSIDTDGDGRLDHMDNCWEVPNGPNLGTCTRGKREYQCQSHSDCGCDGWCSKAQEDCDADGYGNACDECVVTRGGCKDGDCPEFQSFADISPAHPLLGPEVTAQWTEDDQRLFWFILAQQWWLAHEAATYDNIFQAVRGFFNGVDILCRELVRDENNNGILDDNEGIYYSAAENLRMLQEAFERCRDKFDNECSDPEYKDANPFDCMW